MMDKQVDHQKVIWKMKLDYAHVKDDSVLKGFEGLQHLITSSAEPDVTLHDFLQQSADFMAKQLRLRTVTIGLRGIDGKYKYEVMSGLTEEAWAYQKGMVFDFSDFTDSEYYIGEMISKVTKLYLAEENLTSEERKAAYEEPFVKGLRRRSVTDWIEGDYLNTHIIGRDGSLVGWIEVTGTVDGKLPDISTVKWLETLAALLAVRIEKRN